MAKQELRSNNQVPELEPKPEAALRLINGTRAIIIFGRIGVGQSNLGENIAQCLGGVTLYDGGRKIRTATGNTPATTEFMPRDASVDNNIDEAQKNLIRTASPNSPVVIVAKLGGYNASKLALEDPTMKTVKILVTCKRSEAIRRVKKRMTDKITEKSEQAKTLKQVLSETQERERWDFENWTKIYPDLAGVDVFNPQAYVYINGKKIHLYDLTISTTKRSQRESADYLADVLVANGFAERVEAPKPIFPESEI